jgi:hypothetical protein
MAHLFLHELEQKHLSINIWKYQRLVSEERVNAVSMYR